MKVHILFENCREVTGFNEVINNKTIFKIYKSKKKAKKEKAKLDDPELFNDHDIWYEIESIEVE